MHSLRIKPMTSTLLACSAVWNTGSLQNCVFGSDFFFSFFSFFFFFVIIPVNILSPQTNVSTVWSRNKQYKCHWIVVSLLLHQPCSWITSLVETTRPWNGCIKKGSPESRGRVGNHCVSQLTREIPFIYWSLVWFMNTFYWICCNYLYEWKFLISF